MGIRSRASWKARNPKSVVRRALSDKTTIHWNGPTILVAGKTFWDHSKCDPLVRGIQNYHMDAKGWADIAYNFIVCPHGEIYVGRGIDVQNGANGTNIGNRTSHALMTLAGINNDFLESEKAGLRCGVKYISDKSNAPDQSIGHRDHKATDCPGSVRYSWLKAGMPTKTTQSPIEFDPYRVSFKLGDTGPGVGFHQFILNVLAKERIPATGSGHGRVIPVNAKDPHFDAATQEATREIQRFLKVMWELAGKPGAEPRVTGAADRLTLSAMGFWANLVMKKT